MRSSSATPERNGIRRCKPLLGTFVEIRVPDGCQAAADLAFAQIAHVHARMSFQEEGSDLAALRRAPAGTAVQVDPDTVEVLALAQSMHRRSCGLFDVGIGARLVASGFLPRPPGIDLRRMRGTGADIEIVGRDRVVCRRGLLIDLGGIAKGFAVDRAIACLRQAGIERAVVNAGGDLRVLGREQVHLRGADQAIAAVVELHDSAMASSSNLHQRRPHRGRTHTPHLDGRGQPVLSEIAVNVVAPCCALADAMTKIALQAPALADAMLAEHGGFIVRQATPPGLAA
ncbi:FAD:protein FMN transferase [Xanthomonas campestris pv. phormiicola]|nr:FAD:protein FMN transferase [Xanthomonas campestris pv. phormiicola]UYC18577.1 FAD:protein FMN transferase [Xanthomonas campestris pv. phormiicola]